MSILVALASLKIKKVCQSIWHYQNDDFKYRMSGTLVKYMVKQYNTLEQPQIKSVIYQILKTVGLKIIQNKLLISFQPCENKNQTEL